MAKRTIFKSALFVGGVFLALVVLGSVISSGPSQATIEADRTPTTTTTTEPPPEGVVVVRIDNGVLRPSNLELDLDEFQIVKWINEDDREFVIEASDGSFVSPPLSQGDVFEFNFSTLPTALHRYKAILDTDSLFGGVRIPGLVDTRPAQ
ncbi:MAG: hypothetical protein ACC683_00235 [Acidimicrobiia bacterium]